VALDEEMYGFARLLGRVAAPVPDGDFVSAVVRDVEGHTGAGAEQEDDITLVVVRRTASAREAAETFAAATGEVLASFQLASEEGNERLAIDKVVEVVSGLDLDESRLERLKTAVGETVMNAIEHGNQYRADLPVMVEVCHTADAVSVRVTDHGGDNPIPEAETPDIEAKLAGTQTPRGWGLFLVGQMVDEVRTAAENGFHTVELVVNKQGGH
jgi:anti-sigma regulatory factor (Ser/Thr protein kinase)